MTLPNWAREPLVHFLGLGAVIYFGLALADDPVDPSSRVIAVAGEQKAQLALSFEAVMGRAPTDAELDARIDQFVREEVLYREAIRLGLDQGDAVVRQRMVAKMDLTASAAAEAAEPDDAMLRAFYEENANNYAGEGQVSFEQAYFSSEDAARAALGQGAPQGEAISLPSVVKGESLTIRSGFGWHLVRLRTRETKPSDFEQVRARVENDWRSAEIEARKQRAFDVLLSAYRVEIE